MTKLHPDLEALMPEPSFRLKWIEPLAAYRVSKPNIGDADCYTATQMREAILAATERAAKLAEGTDVVDVAGPNSYYCQLGDAAATRAACAAAIRGDGSDQ
jgi:hypothetical protein